jgi:hypothetical protein
VSCSAPDPPTPCKWGTPNVHSGEVESLGAFFQHLTVLLSDGESYMRTFFFEVLGFELRVYTLSHSTVPFWCRDFFEIGSRELFAQGWL